MARWLHVVLAFAWLLVQPGMQWSSTATWASWPGSASASARAPRAGESMESIRRRPNFCNPQKVCTDGVLGTRKLLHGEWADSRSCRTSPGPQDASPRRKGARAKAGAGIARLRGGCDGDGTEPVRKVEHIGNASVELEAPSRPGAPGGVLTVELDNSNITHAGAARAGGLSMEEVFARSSRARAAQLRAEQEAEEAARAEEARNATRAARAEGTAAASKGENTGGESLVDIWGGGDESAAGQEGGEREAEAEATEVAASPPPPPPSVQSGHVSSIPPY